MQVDLITTQRRLMYTPVRPMVVHKVLGRENSLSKVLMYHDEDTFQEFMGLISDDQDDQDIPTTYNLKDRLGVASILTGVMKDAKDLVESIRHYHDLYVDVLMLFELVNMTFFCKEEYLKNTDKTKQFIIHHICRLVKNVSSEICSFQFATDNEGLQTESLLKDVKCMIFSSISSHPHVEQIGRVIQNTDIRNTGKPMTDTYRAYHAKLRARTIIGRNEMRDPKKPHTMYTSPISRAIARPIPDTLLPACTGSMLTKMESTDL
jgi:hypothetical protein